MSNYELRLQSPLPDSAVDKAENAYEVIRHLKKAIQRFQEKPDFRDRCFVGLQIDDSQISKIIDGILNPLDQSVVIKIIDFKHGVVLKCR